MTPAIYRVAADLPGKLSIMPHPPADVLSEAMRSYRAAGVNLIVSMLPEDEAHDLGLRDEAEIANKEGIRFMSHPILDFGLPEMAAFTELVGQISALIRAGEHVAVHCRAGVGRSGMVVASVLCALGETPEAAIEMVSVARGVAIPDTEEQSGFIAAFAAGQA